MDLLINNAQSILAFIWTTIIGIFVYQINKKVDFLYKKNNLHIKAFEEIWTSVVECYDILRYDIRLNMIQGTSPKIQDPQSEILKLKTLMDKKIIYILNKELRDSLEDLWEHYFVEAINKLASAAKSKDIKALNDAFNFIIQNIDVMYKSIQEKYILEFKKL